MILAPLPVRIDMERDVPELGIVNSFTGEILMCQALPVTLYTIKWLDSEPCGCGCGSPHSHTCLTQAFGDN